MGCTPSTTANNNNGESTTAASAASSRFIEYPDRSNKGAEVRLLKRNSSSSKKSLSSQTSINSLSSSSEQTTNNQRDYLSCGLFNLSNIDFCHCHHNQQGRRRQQSKQKQQHRHKNHNQQQQQNRSCCEHCPHSQYKKHISASLTGLHSIVDRAGSSTCSIEECIHLSANYSSENVPPPPKSTTNSCSNVYSVGTGDNNNKQVNISSLRLLTIRDCNIKNHETDDNNNNSSRQHCKLSICQQCLDEHNNNNSNSKQQQIIKDKENQKSKRRSQNLDQIIESDVIDDDQVNIEKSNQIKKPSSLVTTNTNTTLLTTTVLVGKDLPTQHHRCCRHQHLLLIDQQTQQQSGANKSNRSSTTSTSPSTTIAGIVPHHPYCCLYDLTSISTSTNMANCLIRDSSPFEQLKTGVIHQSISDQTLTQKCNNNKMDQQFIQFGRMNIELKKPKLLLVFAEKDDSQANTLCSAGEQAGYTVTLVDSIEAAMNVYVEMQHELIIIDARHSNISGTTSLSSVATSAVATKNVRFIPSKKILLEQEQNPCDKPILQPIDLCKSIRNVKGSEFTTVLALVKRNFIEENDFHSSPIYKSGFNQFFIESFHTTYCVNHLVQLKEFELNMQCRLKAAQTLFTAIDSCKDGIVITGPNHDIRFANQPIEKMFGFRLEDMIGQKTQDFFQTDMMKADVDEKINNYNEGKEWEGAIYQRRKSGESVPIWNRILPINYHKGIPEYIIYIKEFPFLFIEKLMSPERESSLSYGSSIKGHRKVSIDVRSDARRPSLAKFNSVSMIEAPITKVISILMTIKENGPSSLAPTLEKAIDILKNSEVFTPQLQNIRPDDKLTSELVSSLINTNANANKTASRRMSHDVVSQKSSLSYVTQTLSTPTYSHTSLSVVPPEIQKLLDDDLKWNFNVIELERVTNKNPLLWLGLSIFDRFNVRQTLNCSEATVRNWLSVIESNYRNNPYHNSTHAADVMQATAYFLMSDRLRTLLDPLDQAICLIAAIIHDIDHPGRNSAFLANSKHELALLYNDISVLESHHAAYGFKLTVGPNSDRINIFKNLDRETYREVRQSIIDMVLATEMTKHFEHLSKFVNVFQAYNIADNDTLMDLDKPDTIDLSEQPSTSQSDSKSETSLSDLTSAENIVLIKRMLIKCADVSNPGRPTKLCEAWANRIASEYCDQTDEEKKKGLPVVMPTFDKKNCSIPKSQIGFIDYFANDMFEAWHSFGNFPEMIENMNINYEYWKDQLSLGETKQKKPSLESGDIKEVDEENNDS